METFLDAKVGAPTNFNMSFTDFINQPTYVCDLMLEVLEKRAPAKEKEMKDMNDAFDSMTGRGK